MKSLFPLAGSSSRYANLIAEIVRREGYEIYSEPMIGSGTVFFELCPQAAYINDIEPLTTNLYQLIKDDPERLIDEVQKISPVREEFKARQERIYGLDDIERAAAWYFLLWLCYNGVVKQRDGLPYLTWGDRYLTWIDRFPYRAQHIRVASIVLRDAEIYNGDYSLVPPADIAFFDPPWIGSAEDYGVDFNHERLRDYLMTYPGKWILTINKHEESERIYGPISIWEKRLDPYYSVAPSGRGKRQEILIANFVPRMWGG